MFPSSPSFRIPLSQQIPAPAVKPPSKDDCCQTRTEEIVLPIIASLVGFVFLPVQLALAITFTVTVGSILYYTDCFDCPDVKPAPSENNVPPPRAPERATRIFNSLFHGPGGKIDIEEVEGSVGSNESREVEILAPVIMDSDSEGNVENEQPNSNPWSATPFAWSATRGATQNSGVDSNSHQQPASRGNPSEGSPKVSFAYEWSGDLNVFDQFPTARDQGLKTEQPVLPLASAPSLQSSSKVSSNNSSPRRVETPAQQPHFLADMSELSLRSLFPSAGSLADIDKGVLLPGEALDIPRSSVNSPKSREEKTPVNLDDEEVRSQHSSLGGSASEGEVSDEEAEAEVGGNNGAEGDEGDEEGGVAQSSSQPALTVNIPATSNISLPPVQPSTPKEDVADLYFI